MTYIVYATNKDGQGYVLEMGRYESVEDIEIRTGMFAKDIVITIQEVQGIGYE